MTAVRARRAPRRPRCTRRIRRTLEGVLGVPATEGNRIDVLRNGDEIFPAMLDAIAGAEHTIDFLTFVYWAGDIGTIFARALAERARAGVRVRVLLDAYGARTMDRDLIDLMADHGVQVRWFRPAAPLPARPAQPPHPPQGAHRRRGRRVHRRRGDRRRVEGRRPQRTRVARHPLPFRGPIVDGLRAAFLDNWAETDPVLYEEGIDRFPEQPQPGHAVTQCIRGASETGWSDVATLLRTLLQLAEDRVRITTAYFVPDDELATRLCDAADRGVEVDILIPGPYADKRVVQLAAESSYARLLEHGVSIWNYQPTMLHAKLMTVDGHVANIGSANLNRRSFSLDEEINVVALDPDLVTLLDDQFEEDLDRSVRIRPGRWHGRSLTQRTVEQFVVPRPPLLLTRSALGVHLSKHVVVVQMGTKSIEEVNVPETINPKLLSWASDVDPETIRQAEKTARLPIVEGHVALMPDAHVGIGATVGSVIPTKGAVIPSAVGVDIGCGMIAAELDVTAAQLPDNLEPLLAPDRAGHPRRCRAGPRRRGAPRAAEPRR